MGTQKEYKKLVKQGIIGKNNSVVKQSIDEPVEKVSVRNLLSLTKGMRDSGFMKHTIKEKGETK